MIPLDIADLAVIAGHVLGISPAGESEGCGAIAAVTGDRGPTRHAPHRARKRVPRDDEIRRLHREVARLCGAAASHCVRRGQLAGQFGQESLRLVQVRAVAGVLDSTRERRGAATPVTPRPAPARADVARSMPAVPPLRPRSRAGPVDSADDPDEGDFGEVWAMRWLWARAIGSVGTAAPRWPSTKPAASARCEPLLSRAAESPRSYVPVLRAVAQERGAPGRGR